MQEILSFSATHQARLIRQRSISSVELVQAHLARIAAVNPRIHAAIEVLAEQAIAAARAADETLSKGGDAGPLCGVPFSIKDSIELAGTRCTAGHAGAARPRRPPPKTPRWWPACGAPEPSPSRSTNLPDLLFAFESDNLIFGATNNPYDVARTSGGSSGGEAALIASLRFAHGPGQRCRGQRARCRPPSAESPASSRPRGGCRAPVTFRPPAAGSKRCGKSVRWRATWKICAP